jgi:hypothetical protein
METDAASDHHMPDSLAGPREDYGSWLEWAAAARRAYLKVLAVPCPVHQAPKEVPCLTGPDRVCGFRVALA